MPVIAPGLTLQRSAEIFGTLALRTDAFAAFASGSELAVEKSESHGAGTILYAGEIREVLQNDFSPDAVSSFLKALTAGDLHQSRYDLKNGIFTNGHPDSVPLCLSQEDLIRRQDPVAPDLKGPRPLRNMTDVALTLPGVFLDNIARVPADAFCEAAFRALGGRPPETLDLLWMHAGPGALHRHWLATPIVVGSQPPEGRPAAFFRKRPTRFPLVCLQFERGHWKVYPRHVIGRSEARDRILGILRQVPWDLVVQNPQPRASRRAVRKPIVQSTEPPRETPKPPEPPPPPPPPVLPLTPLAAPPVAAIFSSPHRDLVYRGRPGIIAITKVNLEVEELANIPKAYFDLAVRWSLGAREPREGERVAITSGEGFTRKGRINGCILVCPKVPPSRSRTTFPKVWVEYRGGRWIVLAKGTTGRSATRLARAILDVAPWGLVSEKAPGS